MEPDGRASSRGTERAPLAARSPGLFITSLLHAIVFAALARYLPWRTFAPFALGAGLLAVLHLFLVALALTRRARAKAFVFRATAITSLAFLGFVVYSAVSGGLYVHNLYGGIGDALALAAGAVALIVFSVTVPFAAWGLARTGGVFRRRGSGANRKGPALLTLVLLLGMVGIALRASRATPATSRAWLEESATVALAGLATLPRGEKRVPLFTKTPAICEATPSPDRATLFATYARDSAFVGCFQADSLTGAANALSVHLREAGARGPVLVDIVKGTQRLPSTDPLFQTVLLRPGLDGVCDERTCLTPWQLVALDQFTKFSSFAAIQLKIGLSGKPLHAALGTPGDSLTDLVRIDTESYLFEGGKLERLDRMRREPPPLERATVERGVRDATAFIVAAQDKDGRFRYLVDPFTGKTSYADFSVPRQAGTTLALCEMAGFDKRAVDAARASLSMLRTLEQSKDEVSVIQYPKGRKGAAGLGTSALTLIAMLGCRPVVGTANDATIRRLASTMLAMQREDGGYHPSFDLSKKTAIPGRDPLYAAGQVVLALVLYEASGMPDLPADLRARIDRSMAYFSGPYWRDHAFYDFFYLEENWHCLAARAALTHHRNDAYERFCIDYMTMKSRLVTDADSGVDPDFVGAYGFGDVFVPHHAAAAGFGEALAAVMAIKSARGESTEKDEATLTLTLTYLLRYQWREEDCQLCTDALPIGGAFSESVASGVVRIDFVQHAMAALAHGGRRLGYFDENLVRESFVVAPFEQKPSKKAAPKPVVSGGT